MIKTLLLICWLHCLAPIVFAQHKTVDAFNQQRLNLTKKSMQVLGGWATANIITSAFSLKTNNPDAYYFHQMNIMWNSVNLALSGLGYWGAVKNKKVETDLASSIKHQHKTEKLFLFNAGIDVAYIAAGGYLKQKSKNNSKGPKLNGYGNAVILQGSFLFLFDMINYAIHVKHGKQLDKFISNLQVSPGGAGIAAVYNF